MGFDVSKAMKDEDPDEEVSAADLARARDPLRGPLEQYHEAIRNLSGIGSVQQLFEQQRQQVEQQVELVRNLSGFDQVRQIAEQATRSMTAAHDAQAVGISRQVQDALAAYDSQVAGMSRQILEALNAQLASVRLPQVEAFRPPLDPGGC